MASFVPAQFSSFSSNFDRLREDPNSSLNVNLANIKSPQDFFDYHRIKLPTSTADLNDRCSFNLDYFKSNYLLIFIVSFTIHLIFNLHNLYLIIAFAVLCFVFSKASDITTFADLNLQSLNAFFNNKRPLAIAFILFGIPLAYWNLMILFNFLWGSKLILFLIAHSVSLNKPSNSLADEEMV